MLISIRTLINTTLFWIIVVFWFRLYTKYDPTPAKYLLYTIGRDNLWNIQVVDNQIATNNTVEDLSNQLIAERLSNLEEICSKSVRLSIYDQPTSMPVSTIPTVTSINPSAPIVTTGTQTIPVIDNSNLLRNTTILQ
jgi:hypothetical protein